MSSSIYEVLVQPTTCQGSDLYRLRSKLAYELKFNSSKFEVKIRF